MKKRIVIFCSVFGVLSIIFFACYYYKTEVRAKFRYSISKDKRWALCTSYDAKGFWDGYFIYLGNKDGNIGSIKIKGKIGTDIYENEYKNKLEAEEFLDGYQQLGFGKKKKKYCYVLIELYPEAQPEMSFEISYKENGKKRISKVKMKKADLPKCFDD